MISLITTVFNERKNIERWLESILNQSLKPDEIVIVDGGSNDGTWEWLQQKSQLEPLVKSHSYPGNISMGRNHAIKMASGEFIVVADGGCRYDNDWFRAISEPFSRGYEFIAGAFGPWLQKSDGFLKLLIFSATTPSSKEFVKNWLASSRSVAFTKDLWQRAGGYPEWLPICEDIIYDLKALKLNPKIYYQRKPMAFWEARDNLKKFFLQLFRYTRGDGHGKLWIKRQLIRYAVYAVSLVLLLLSIFVSPYFLILLLVGLIFYMKKFWVRWLEFTVDKNFIYRFFGILCVPLIMVFGDVAKMLGWPVGVYQRRTGKIKFQKY